MAVLDHIGLYVEDLEKSQIFYGGFFGFREHSRLSVGQSKMVFLNIGYGLLELIQRPGAPGEPSSGKRSHVAFHVDNFDEIKSRIEGTGLEFLEKSLEDGTRVGGFKDPDGHYIEIVDRPFFQKTISHGIKR